MAKILITGGTGLVGSRLTELLINKKHEVNILTRTPDGSNEYKWDLSKNSIDIEAFNSVDYIIHLAGAGIAVTNSAMAMTAKSYDNIIGSNERLNVAIAGLGRRLNAFKAPIASKAPTVVTEETVIKP